MSAFVAFGAMVVPVFISPLFNTYTEMKAGALRDRIVGMAQANNVPAEHIYVFDASKQTKRISANVSGLGPTIRISLNDNLLNRTKPPETAGPAPLPARNDGAARAALAATPSPAVEQTIMAGKRKEQEREDRIVNEVVVDAYDASERAMGWYYYLEEMLQCPFTATCVTASCSRGSLPGSSSPRHRCPAIRGAGA
jgi:hypothetical protein